MPPSSKGKGIGRARRGENSASTDSGSGTNDTSSPRPQGEETSATPTPGTVKDNGRFYYRQAFAKANMDIAEGIFTYHPDLPEDLKTILTPIKCVPTTMQEMVPVLFHSSDFSILSSSVNPMSTSTTQFRTFYMRVKSRLLIISFSNGLKRCTDFRSKERANLPGELSRSKTCLFLCSIQRKR